jgi:hypothetical protein
MKTYSIFFLALFGLLMFSSCSKDDESATDLLTGGTWKLTESRSDTDGDGSLEDDLEPCSADDTVKFEDGGSFTFDEGATKCDPADEQTNTGTWALSSEDKVLTLTQDGISIAAEIVSLTSKRLELKITFLGVQEAVYTR